MKKILVKLVETSLAGAGMYWPYLLKRRESQLTEDGWFASAQARAPVDREGNPVPWMTYSFLDFIRTRLKPELKVFEYGCGNSTIWFSKRVATMISVEHEAAWHDKVKASLPANSRLIHAGLEDGERYEKACLEPGLIFDIVIVDGRKRIRCAQNAVKVLAPGGVIVWDNTEREEYLPGIKELAALGFRRLDFWGMSPMNIHKTCTSLLYRAENCLGL